MELDLSPKLAKKLFEGDGGAYYFWSSLEYPALGQPEVGAATFVLQPRGFALPHYADSSKIGYVLQGTAGIVGMVPPKTTEESVLKIKKGDIIVVPTGFLSWWFNDGDSDLVVIFLGQITKPYVPGEFTYFFVAGPQGMLSGFSTEFTSRILGVSQQDTNPILQSQKAVLITRLEEGKIIPQARTGSDEKLVYNVEGDLPDIAVRNGGSLNVLTAAKFPSLEQVGLSARLVKLDPNAMSAPIYTADATTQVIYIFKGSGRIQIVGLNGEQVLDTEFMAGQLIVVPRFFAVAKLAGEEGMECFTMITSPEPVIEELGGKSSIWAALSPAILDASLNVTPEITKQIRSNITTTDYLIPPS